MMPVDTYSMVNYVRAHARRSRAVASQCAVIIAAALTAAAYAAWPNLPATPLAIQNISDPNLLLTLDDSGSMASAYAPDSIGVDDGKVYFLSARYNSLAYNPFDQYDAPYDPVALNGTRLTTSFNAAWYNGFYTTRGSVNLSSNYRPIKIYDPVNTGAGTFAAAWTSGAAAFIYVFYNDLSPGNTLPAPGTDPTTFARRTALPAGCGGLTATTTVACYIKVVIPTTDGHQQNFANWYSFYKTRNLSVASAANIALYDLNPRFRMSWQSLNVCKDFNNSNCKGWDNPGTSIPNKLRPLEATGQKASFYKYLSRLPASGNTPLRSAVDRAGTFIKGTGIESPRANQLGISESGPDGSPISACRGNYHVLLTDGVWNNAETGFTAGNLDNSAVTLGDPSKTYTPMAPYKDANANSIADLAFQQWANDAQPGLANSVVPNYVVTTLPATAATIAADYWNPRNDPATWQHMNTFAIGLGLNGYLNGTTDSGAGYLPLWGGSTFAGDFNALSAGTKAWPTTFDNSAGNVADLWHAAINGRGEFFGADSPSTVRDAFRSILARISSTETSAGQRESSSRRVGTNSISFSVRYKPSDWYSTITARSVNSDGTTDGAALWTTDTTLTSDSPSRSLFTWDAASGPSGSSRTFAWNQFSNAEKSSFFGTIALPSGDEDLLNYLRGNRSQEGGKFRQRKQVLGDVVGSEMVATAKTDQGFEFLPASAGGSTYRAFVGKKKTAVFVGSNDGMVHGFNDAGAELFGYIPGAVLPKLKELAKAVLIHVPLVDGPLTLSDAYLGSAWKTLLVGALGGGGKSVFGLDVTSVTQTGGSGTFTGSNVLFEVTDPEMGYGFSKPVVGRTVNGDWVAIWGNGYGGLSAKGFLFVYNLTSKTLTKIDTGVGSTTAGQENGLSSAVGMEFAAGNMVAVYAGDYQGNMWKFNVGSTGAFALANGTTPFFKAVDSAGNQQPITAAPEVAVHPAGGAMVMFGTGKFFETQDRGTRNVNTFYSLRDRGENVVFTRSNLVQQTITSGTSVTAARRTVSTNAVDYTAKKGWYLDFSTTQGTGASGERIVASPVQLSDLVVFNTYTPNENTCEGNGIGYLMGLNAFTGGLPSAVFDINGDGVVNGLDRPAGGGDNYAGLKSSGTEASLSSPVPSLVGLQPAGVNRTSAPGASCGVINTPPCIGPVPAAGCDAGLIVKNNLCSAVACQRGGIVVDSACTMSADAKYPRWMELKWK